MFFLFFSFFLFFQSVFFQFMHDMITVLISSVHIHSRKGLTRAPIFLLNPSTLCSCCFFFFFFFFFFSLLCLSFCGPCQFSSEFEPFCDENKFVSTPSRASFCNSNIAICIILRHFVEATALQYVFKGASLNQLLSLFLLIS